MESLTEQQRIGISKMSDARLRTKLIQVGYKPDDVAQLERVDLLAEWTRVVAVRGEEPAVAEAAEPADVVYQPGDVEEGVVNPDVTKARLALEERRMMMEENVKMRELELKRRELELKERKFEREQAHKEREFELRESENKLTEIAWVQN